MKNSKNKIVAAVICGMVLGSVGTSVVGDFQGKKDNEIYTASNEIKSSTSDKNSDAADTLNENSERGEKGPGGKGGHHKGEASLDSTESIDVSTGNYNDGVYKGTADGYAKNLSVQVEISDGKISDIEITSHNETPGFYEKAFELVPAEIIENQSTNVDTASGATYSSVGIINAVNNALADSKA